jgi:hypothetical protein
MIEVGFDGGQLTAGAIAARHFSGEFSKLVDVHVLE